MIIELLKSKINLLLADENYIDLPIFCNRILFKIDKNFDNTFSLYLANKNISSDELERYIYYIEECGNILPILSDFASKKDAFHAIVFENDFGKTSSQIEKPTAKGTKKNKYYTNLEITQEWQKLCNEEFSNLLDLEKELNQTNFKIFLAQNSPALKINDEPLKIKQKELSSQIKQSVESYKAQHSQIFGDLEK